MRHAALDRFRAKGRAEFEHFDVMRFDERFKGSEIDGPGARRHVVPCRKFHVVDMEPDQMMVQ